MFDDSKATNFSIDIFVDSGNDKGYVGTSNANNINFGNHHTLDGRGVNQFAIVVNTKETINLNDTSADLTVTVK